MAFFTSEIAYTLQYISFPLEVIGLTLATIEVRFPDIATSIVRFIRTEWDSISTPEPMQRSEYANSLVWFYYKSDYWIRTHWIFVFGTILLATPLILAVPLAEVIIDLNGSEIVKLASFTGITIVIGAAAFFAPVIILVFCFWAALKWVNGREVGTLGIIIAGFGVLGEAYQFTTQLLV